MQTLEADATLPFPRPVVFAAYRDHTPALVEYLPNIRKIEVKERSDEEDGIVKLVNIWHGGGELPAAARVVLSDNMMSWTDYATWNPEEWSVAWRIETHSFSEAVRCEGKNRFYDTPDGTRLEIRGEIHIDGSKVAGVPKFMRKNVSNMVTDFLKKKITPNLLEVSGALQAYLEKNGAG